MGRINHYDAYVAYKNGEKAKDIAERYDSDPQTIYAVVHREEWDRRHLADPFQKTLKDKMIDLYEEKFGLNYRNGVSKLYRTLCRYYNLSYECKDDNELLKRIAEIDSDDIYKIPGVSASFARVIEQMRIDVQNGAFE